MRNIANVRVTDNDGLHAIFIPATIPAILEKLKNSFKANYLNGFCELTQIRMTRATN